MAKQYFEARVKIKGQTYFGSSYESASFALAKLSSLCIDAARNIEKDTILSTKHIIKLTEFLEDESTGLLEFVPFSNQLSIRGTYHEIEDQLSKLEGTV